MASMYLQGTHGTIKDEKMAVKLMTLSANQGCSVAVYNKARWYLDGAMGHEKKPQKAYKMLSKARKDPLIDFNGAGADIYAMLSKMRLYGNGCNRNPVKAQEHLNTAEKFQPGKIPKDMFDMVDLIVSLSPASSHQESDLRSRRLNVARRNVEYLTLNEWASLHAHYGLPFSNNPSSTGDGDIAVNLHGLQEWKIKVGSVDELPETYPAMNDPLPPLECKQCHKDEIQITGKMMKCEECQAPYCSVECQRIDWKIHRPVCSAVSAQFNPDVITDHEQEYLRELDPNILKNAGIPQSHLNDLLTKPTKRCEHDEFGIPCSSECLKKRGAVTQNKYNYNMVAAKKITQVQKDAATRLGFNIDFPDRL